MSAESKKGGATPEKNKAEAPRYGAIIAAKNARDGWAESMKEMAARGHDRLFLEDTHRLTEWEANEWRW